MLRAAIVGCGKIADDHASQILRVRGSRIVGVCDREPLMARQLSDRFPVDRRFDSLEDLLAAGKPDVVHITTPPQSHFELARQCLQAGVNVYVEKPFTVDAKEASALVALANERGVKLTAGHDDQFRPAARRMRALIQSGYLGARPLHLESYYGYELGPDAYAGALLADRQHWIRKLPGGLLHNIISHGVARIAEYLTTDSPSVQVYGFTSPLLKSLGERDIIDELRVLVSEQDAVTAYFTFSSQIRPGLHQFRAYGPANSIILDQDQETVIKVRGRRYKSYAEKFVPPITLAGQYLGNFFCNAGAFLRSEFHMKEGMKHLIECFYLSIVNGTPVPIRYSEIVLTAEIMDRIFAQLGSQSAEAAGHH
jgi:predicted dehydrogenase